MPETNLGQYRTAVGSKIGMTYSTSGDERDRIDRWVNEGVERFMVDTSCYIVSGTISLSSGVDDYTIDKDSILQVTEAYVTDANSDQWDFQRVSPGEIVAFRRTTTAASEPARFFATQGSNLLMVWPTPSDSNSTLTFYYVPRPAIMDDSSETPLYIPDEFHKAVEYWALAEAADWDDDGSSQQGDRYRARYLEMVASYRGQQQRSFGRKLAAAVIGRRRQIRFARDKDVRP